MQMNIEFYHECRDRTERTVVFTVDYSPAEEATRYSPPDGDYFEFCGELECEKHPDFDFEDKTVYRGERPYQLAESLYIITWKDGERLEIDQATFNDACYDKLASEKRDAEEMACGL